MVHPAHPHPRKKNKKNIIYGINLKIKKITFMLHPAHTTQDKKNKKIPFMVYKAKLSKLSNGINQKTHPKIFLIYSLTHSIHS